MMDASILWIIFLVTQFGFLVEGTGYNVHSKNDKNNNNNNNATDILHEKRRMKTDVRKNPHLQPTNASSFRALRKRTTIHDGSMTIGRKHFWEKAWPMYDESKTNTALWELSDTGGRPTLTKMHYIIAAGIFKDQKDSFVFDYEQTNQEMEKVVQQYLDMSWGKNLITYEIWDPIQIDILSEQATEDDLMNAIDVQLKRKDYVEFVDYTGKIALFQLNAEGGFGFWGGWAYMNDNTAWMSLEISAGVTRHELGHNYGHDHPQSNTYEWRMQRGAEEYEPSDRFTFMSGGNGYESAHFHAASKWFFNWMPNDSVILMQPEGPSEACPTCIQSVTDLVLTTFDNRDLPPSSGINMAVHIPITATPWDTYSYWLSYRGSGVDGDASGGLSVHLTKFYFDGGIFGASYNSWLFDAFGDSETLLDSLVVPETCYLISPPSMMMDIDPASVEQVQPIVCVDSIDRGNTITISVSFMDPKASPQPNIPLASNHQHTCSKDENDFVTGSLAMTTKSKHLFHFTGTGFSSTVAMSLCRSSSSAPKTTAYFYDSYPHAVMALNSPVGYGAYRRIDVVSLCSSGWDTLEYSSENNETFIIVQRNESSPVSQQSDIKMKYRCTLSTCNYNQYMNSDGYCSTCPDGVSQRESTSIDDCFACTADGMLPEHPLSPNCIFPSPELLSPTLKAATDWRLVVKSTVSEEAWWDLESIRLYSSNECTSDSILDVSTATAVYDSGHWDGYGPEFAFDDSDDSDDFWGGTPDDRGLLWIAISFPFSIDVKCVRFRQFNETYANELFLQAREESSSWYNVGFAQNLGEGEGVVKAVRKTTNPNLCTVACRRMSRNGIVMHKLTGSNCVKKCFVRKATGVRQGYKCGPCP